MADGTSPVYLEPPGYTAPKFFVAFTILYASSRVQSSFPPRDLPIRRITFIPRPCFYPHAAWIRHTGRPCPVHLPTFSSVVSGVWLPNSFRACYELGVFGFSLLSLPPTSAPWQFIPNKPIFMSTISLSSPSPSHLSVRTLIPHNGTCRSLFPPVFDSVPPSHPHLPSPPKTRRFDGLFTLFRLTPPCSRKHLIHTPALVSSESDPVVFYSDDLIPGCVFLK